MANKLVCLAFGFCLAIFSTGVGKGNPKTTAGPNQATMQPATAQPLSSCIFNFAGRWFGEGWMLEAEQGGNQVIWSVEALNTRITSRCGDGVLSMRWRPPLGDGAVRGRVEGQPGGLATLVRWTDGRIFARIPDLAITADRNAVRRGEPIELRAQIEPRNNAVSRYFINFGDGRGGDFDPPSVRHVYESPGVFEVVLTAILLDSRFNSPPFRSVWRNPERQLISD